MFVEYVFYVIDVIKSVWTIVFELDKILPENHSNRLIFSGV